MICSKCGHSGSLHVIYETPVIYSKSIICMHNDCFCYELWNEPNDFKFGEMNNEMS